MEVKNYPPGSWTMRAKSAQPRVCQHDVLVVDWSGDPQTSRIHCADCEWVYWDKRAPVSFVEAMDWVERCYTRQ
jgi:hypothetical protein